MENSPATVADYPDSLRRELVDAQDGAVIHDSGASPEQATQTVLQKPGASMDPASKALSLPPVSAGAFAGQTSLAGVGATLASQLGVTKVIVRQAGDNVSFEGQVNPTAKDILQFVSPAFKAADLQTALTQAEGAPLDANWAAVFATAGKKLTTAPNGAGATLTFKKVLKGNGKTLDGFRDEIRDAIIQTLNKQNNRGVKKALTAAQIPTLAMDKAQAIVDNVGDNAVFFIRPTDMPRKVANGSLVRLNGAQSRAESLYHGVAANSKDPLLSQVKGQLHHVIPLYLGGGHEEDSLVQAEGMARIETAAHGALHAYIDELDISKFLGEAPDTTTLTWGDLANAFKDKDLDLLIGELQGDSPAGAQGAITYRKAEKKGTTIKLVPA